MAEKAEEKLKGWSAMGRPLVFPASRGEGERSGEVRDTHRLPVKSPQQERMKENVGPGWDIRLFCVILRYEHLPVIRFIQEG